TKLLKKVVMGSSRNELYFVFMNLDPEYDRLQTNQSVSFHTLSKHGALELDSYLRKKHDDFLASALEAGTNKKRYSLVIVDGFAVEMCEDQADVLRSAKEVRIVEKNQELG
ncbi:hypothetical protein IFM89_021346, partial [Coptis chinensis]